MPDVRGLTSFGLVYSVIYTSLGLERGGTYKNNKNEALGQVMTSAPL